MAEAAQQLFTYPDTPHRRRYGPAGYTHYESYKPWLRDEFLFRCVYCLVRERWFHSGSAVFSVEHIVPKSVDSTRITDYSNLAYACLRCNSIRQERAVLNPCEAAFATHVRVRDDGGITGLTLEGLAHIKVLRLDDPELTEFRGRLIDTVRGLESDTTEASRGLLHRWVGFPDDLPDLAALRPPGGNRRPGAVRECWYARREQGALPDRY